MVFVVVPREEHLSEPAGILQRPEAIGKRDTVLERSELRLEERGKDALGRSPLACGSPGSRNPRYQTPPGQTPPGHGNLRLSANAADPLGVLGQRRGQNLYRHVAVELRVTRAEHFAHAAFAELGGDFLRAEAISRRQH